MEEGDIRTVNGRCDRGRKVQEDTPLLTLKMEKGTQAKEYKWPLGPGRGNDMDFPLESP